MKGHLPLSLTMSNRSDYNAIGETIWTPTPLEKKALQQATIIDKHIEVLNDLSLKLHCISWTFPPIPRTTVRQKVASVLNGLINAPVPKANNGNYPAKLVSEQREFVRNLHRELDGLCAWLRQKIRAFRLRDGDYFISVPTEECKKDLETAARDML